MGAFPSSHVKIEVNDKKDWIAVGNAFYPMSQVGTIWICLDNAPEDSHKAHYVCLKILEAAAQASPKYYPYTVKTFESVRMTENEARVLVQNIVGPFAALCPGRTTRTAERVQDD